MSKWIAAYFCQECNQRVSGYDRAYNNGVCPHCGHISDSTFVDTVTRVYRKTLISPWWMFWKKRYRIEWKDNDQPPANWKEPFKL